MWKYPDGTYKTAPPVRVELNGYVYPFAALSTEQLDAAGYNEAVPLRREPYTTYTTEWVKGADLIYREEIVTAVVDEEAKAAAEHEARIAEIKAELAALDLYVPRSMEDFIDSGVAATTDLSTYNQDRLASKVALRLELADLLNPSEE